MNFGGGPSVSNPREEGRSLSYPPTRLPADFAFDTIFWSCQKDGMALLVRLLEADFCARLTQIAPPYLYWIGLVPASRDWMPDMAAGLAR